MTETEAVDAPQRDETPDVDDVVVSVVETPETETDEDDEPDYEAIYRDIVEAVGEESVTDFVVAGAVRADLAPFLDAAAESIKAASVATNNRCSFHLVREPRGEFYVLRTLAPDEWNTAWLPLFERDAAAAELYTDDVLQLTMVYPSFAECDWQWTGEGINAPHPHTKSRLLSAYLEGEFPPQDHRMAFTMDELSAAETARKKVRAKASF